ncbi:putative AC transposase [Grifola frondosa]|uniref:Putative AC transposase n=1 Tax=Grifola frondosa TaxID=5627 RepID=A0A1C7LLK1_GRIFR|nr:putative AC transposase [Grifola frondosa]
MYSLYKRLQLIHDRKQIPTVTEIQVAKAEKPRECLPYRLDSPISCDNHESLLPGSEPFDYNTWVRLVCEWIAACDEPFDAVERPEWIKMVRYASRRGDQLKTPSADTVKNHVMTMADDVVASIKSLIRDLDAKVSLALDCWTSSNKWAFLCIVMSFVTEDWELEETVIDFHEVQGEHSGENLAELVWQTIETYGLKEKLLKTVGLVNGPKATSDQSRPKPRPRSHESIQEPLSSQADDFLAQENDAAADANSRSESVPDPKEVEALLKDPMDITQMVKAIQKLRLIVRTVRSTPQRKQQWLDEVNLSLRSLGDACDHAEQSLMLILDVVTRWSSTHQMLRRALKYKDTIKAFIAKRVDLRHLELDEKEWDTIKLVTDWLYLFRSATETMSASKETTLSLVHTVFHSLQDHLKKELSKLPAEMSAILRQGLIDAHRKLSDYHTYFDESPYYILLLAYIFSA